MISSGPGPPRTYSNIKQIPWLTVASSLAIVIITLLFALAMPQKEDARLGPVDQARKRGAGRLTR